MQKHIARAAKMHEETVEEEEEASRRDPDNVYHSDEDPEQNEESSYDEFSPQEIFDDWMVSLRLDQRKMLSVILMETFKNRMKLNTKDAATEAGLGRWLASMIKLSASTGMTSILTRENSPCACKTMKHSSMQRKTIVQEAQQLLEYRAEKDGYWTSDHFMEQVKNAAKIAEFKLVWLFDQSSCHHKFHEHALQAKNILVKDCGARRVRETVWVDDPKR